MRERILTLARDMGAPAGQEALLEALVQAAQAELEGRLRPGLTPEDCGQAFPVAAAWMALAGLEGGEDVTGFTAGDVTLRRGNSRGEALLEQAGRLMAPYTTGTGFAFLGVRG